MKDFYDIWTLTKKYTIDKKEFLKVMQGILKNRDTVISKFPIAFTEAFYDNQHKINMWKGFLNNISAEEVSLKKVVVEISDFYDFII